MWAKIGTCCSQKVVPVCAEKVVQPCTQNISNYRYDLDNHTPSTKEIYLKRALQLTQIIATILALSGDISALQFAVCNLSIAAIHITQSMMHPTLRQQLKRIEISIQGALVVINILMLLNLIPMPDVTILYTVGLSCYYFVRLAWCGPDCVIDCKKGLVDEDQEAFARICGW